MAYLVTYTCGHKFQAVSDGRPFTVRCPYCYESPTREVIEQEIAQQQERERSRDAGPDLLAVAILLDAALDEYEYSEDRGNAVMQYADMLKTAIAKARGE